ncbi:MAG: hypothetical protein DME74_08545 [Verrucomicrobia bacterium]|nr:MAG: hypothetical protein DME74_08545 [Verrucomicrobiota bacterium]
MPAVATASMIRREIGDDHVCTLTFDRPESGANIFDAATLDELNEHLDFVEHEDSLRALIIASAKKSIFIAGADLKTLLQQAQSGDMRAFIATGQRIFSRLADLKIPTVAAMHGACAGGGYEVTLACDYRIATDDPATRIGLPETTLGLIPAWGGCTRLPRLIGAEKAADVILKGKLYSAQEALKLGLVDEIAPRDQLIHRAKERLRVGKRKMEGGYPGTPASLAPPRQHGNPIDAESDPQFLSSGEIQERSFKDAERKSRTRSCDWRGGHGLGYCAMGKLSRRDGDSARHRARTDRLRFGKH